MERKGGDQKTEYRRRVVERIADAYPGMLSDLARLIADYALNAYFCPLAEISLNAGDRVDVRLHESKGLEQKGEWVKAQVAPISEEGIIEDGFLCVSLKNPIWPDIPWTSSIPVRMDRIQPDGWFTDGQWSDSFANDQLVWVWDRMIQQWARGTVTQTPCPGSQWKVEFKRPAFQLVPGPVSHKPNRRKRIGLLRKLTLPPPHPSVFCAGEIRARMDDIPPSQPLHPEDGAVKMFYK